MKFWRKTLARKKTYSTLFLLLLTALVSACGNVSDSKQIAKWRVDPVMTPRPAKTVMLIIREDAGNPTLFLRYDGKEMRIGPMTHQLGDAPALAQFADIDGNRFVILLVDGEVSRKVNGLLIYRQDPNFPEQPEKSREAVSVLMDKNGMIVAPLGPNHAPEWTHITEIILTPKNSKEGNVYRHIFSPPLPLQFKEISLSDLK